MTRPFAILSALLLTTATLNTTSFAANLGEIRFALSTERSPAGRAQLTLTDDGRRASVNSTSVALDDLAGLDTSALSSGRAAPLRFALVRDAGRLDCSGTGQLRHSKGECRFTADRGFSDYLVRHGIDRPTDREAFTLAMVGANRALVAALSAARYPTPGISDLAGLAALGVTPDYIRDLARRGYRPEKVGDLLAFKALDVTPAYVDALRRAGFDRLSAAEIVQFKALDVSPAYAASLRAIGYGDVSANEIVQLKALGVTADYIAGFQRLGNGRIPVSKLIEYKALGVTPANLGSLRKKAALELSTDDLVQMKVVGLLP